MKKVFTIIFAAACVQAANAQFSLGIGAGYSSKNSPVMELQVSNVTPRGLAFSAGYQVHISNRVSNPAIIQAKAGYQLPLGAWASLIPSAGYAFHLHSTDNKAMNKHTYLLSAQLERITKTERGLIYLNTTYSNKIFIVTIGIKGLFN